MARTFGRLWLEGLTWKIDAEPHVAMRLKRVFGKVNRYAHGVLGLAHAPDVARDLEWFCQRYPLEVDQASAATLAKSAASQRETTLRLEQIMAPGYTPQAFELALPARRYQAREAAVYLEQGHLLIADDVGLGKTASAICSFADPRTLPAVVVAMTHLQRQWHDEIAKFAPALTAHIIKRGTPYPLPTFFGRHPDVIILTYHKLAGWAEVLAKSARSVVFDEVQELRHAGSQKSDAARQLAESVPFRLGLSATPIFNYGGEIFNVLDVLEHGALGTREEFNREWCAQIGQHHRLTNPRAFGTYLREQFLMVRHTRREVGRELPDIVKVPHAIEANRAALDRVRGDAATLARLILKEGEERRGEKMQAGEELSNMLRQATGLAKAPYVADFVRMLVESGEKVVLCGWHRAVYGVWLQKLADLRPRLYTGSETDAEKEASRAAFVNGNCQVLILSLRSGAGLNSLQEAASIIVFGELDWSPGVHEQCIGRLHRDGQGGGVVAYFLIAKDGIDPVIAEVLGLKKEQIEGIRSPEQADLIEKLETTGDRARRVAEFYLERIGARA